MPEWNQRKISDVLEQMRRVEEVVRREKSEEVRQGRIEEVSREKNEQSRERNEEVRKERIEEVRREEERLDLLGKGSTEVVGEGVEEEDIFSPSQQAPRRRTKKVEVAVVEEEVEESQDMFAPTQEQPRRKKKRVEVAKEEEEGSQDMFAPTPEGLPSSKVAIS